MLSMRRLKNCIALLLALCLLMLSTAALAAPTPTPVPSLPPFDETVAEYSEENPGALTVDQLYAQAAILINQDNGQVLLEKNADVRMNPASTTKIMTALLAMEYGNLNSVVTIPEEAAQVPEDSSVVPVTPGEEMTFVDLLYGFMLKSGNDAGNAIAVIIAGSVDAFVDMMNARAAELGCVNTHFVNPHGYTAEGHYTTARDMAIITQEAMKHSLFRKIVIAGDYTMNKSNMRDEMIVRNSNMLVVYGSEYRYEHATGVKTGTTSAAGQCLVGSATHNGINLISVVFKSTVAFPHAKWQDTERIFEYGFDQYHTYTFDELYEMMNVVVPISGADPEDSSGGMVRLKAVMNRTGSYEKTIHKGDADQLLSDFRSRVQIEYTRELTAPIENGTIMGNLTFTSEEGNVITAVLVADRSVTAAQPVSTPWDPIGWITALVPGWLLALIGVFFLFLIILMIARAVVAARKRRRRRLARERALARQRERARMERMRQRQNNNRRPPMYR